MLNHIIIVPHLHNLIHNHAAFLFTLISGSHLRMNSKQMLLGSGMAAG